MKDQCISIRIGTNRWAKRFRLPFLTLLVLALGSSDALQVVRATHSWGNYHWRRSKNPITIPLIDSMSSSYDPLLNVAIADWNESTVVQFKKVSGQAAASCNPVAGKVRACNGRYGFNGWEGLATIWLSGGHISQGTAKMNDTYLRTGSQAKKQMVTCQEIGHLFGLDHQDENFYNPPLKTCMDYTVDANVSQNQHPNNHDYDQLKKIYRHLDAATSELEFPPPGFNESLDLPSQWGRLVKSGNDGRTELYELDFGGGYRVFTFVIWER